MLILKWISILFVLLWVLVAKEDTCKWDPDSSSSVDPGSTSCGGEASAPLTTYQKVIKKQGSGEFPRKGDQVTVHCTGYGKNGDLSVPFWSTMDPGQQPFTFKIGLNQVIRAWDEGVLTMKVGEVAEITASPEYGYGKQGFPRWGIEPNSVLKFEIEVVSIK